MAKQWAEMSSDEKQEEMFNRWLSPKDPEGNDFKFPTPEAEKAFKERITRIKDAIQMKKLPDRVPVLLIPSFAPAYYSGLSSPCIASRPWDWRTLRPPGKSIDQTAHSASRQTTTLPIPCPFSFPPEHHSAGDSYLAPIHSLARDTPAMASCP